MKLSYYSFANLCLILFLASCSSDESTIESTTIEEVKIEPASETKGMRAYDLRAHELDIHIWIPEKFYNDEEDLPRFVEPWLDLLVKSKVIIYKSQISQFISSSLIFTAQSLT